MGILESTSDFLRQLKRNADLGRICFQDVGRFEECNQVWAVIGIVLGIACLLVLAFIARHFYREYSGYQRVRKRRLAEMEVADPEVMSQYVWSGDKALEHGLTQDEVIQRIKDAKAQKRAASDNATGNVTLGTGPRQQ